MARLPKVRVNSDTVFIVETENKAFNGKKYIKEKSYYICFVGKRKRGGGIKTIEYPDGREVDLKEIKKVEVWEKPINIERLKKDLIFDDNCFHFFTKKDDMVKYLNNFSRK